MLQYDNMKNFSEYLSIKTFKVNIFFCLLRSKIFLFLQKFPFYKFFLWGKSVKITKSIPVQDHVFEYDIDENIPVGGVFLKTSGRCITLNSIWDFCEKEVLDTSEEFAEMHTFCWMEFISIVVDKKLREQLRASLLKWINIFYSLNTNAWKAPIVAQRVFYWITYYNVVSKTADKFNIVFITSLVRQVKFLLKICHEECDFFTRCCVFRGLIYYFFATKNTKLVKKYIKYFIYHMRDISLANITINPYQTLKTLEYLLDIQFVLSCCKIHVPSIMSFVIKECAELVRFLRYKNGNICAFGSSFTPCSAYVDSILCKVVASEVDIKKAGYFRADAFGNTLIIDSKSPMFPFEFVCNGERMILGSKCIILKKNENADCKNFDFAITEASQFIEKSNFWFDGESIVFKNIDFKRRLFFNNVGDELKCESVMYNHNFIEEFLIPSNIQITELEYQNGLFLNLENGVRWTWSVSKNTLYTFCETHSQVLDGRMRNFTRLRLQSKNHINKWAIKRV